MSDPLLEAAQALREQVQGDEQAIGRGTRARILTAVRLQQRRRIVKLTFGIPLAAILVGSGAWAASQPTISLWVQRVADSCGMRIPASTSAVDAVKPLARRGSGLSREARESPNPGAGSASALSPAAPLQALAPSEKTEPTTATNLPRPNASAQADSLTTQRDFDRYEAAHRQHFSGNDPKSALAAWNDYLRQMPHGRFVVEAKYNRAMCLVRLGRHREALEALRPFADGSFGNYRRSEAKSLCEQLAQTPASTAPAALD